MGKGMKIGSLFSGYGGLDLALKMVFPDAETVWLSDVQEFDKKGGMIGNAPAILAERFPGIPNIGDITQIDWQAVEPVDIIIGGSPCQDLSMAGRRAGMQPGTRSGLWESMFEAIKTIRPRLVVWENVKGALSAPAFSLMESREGHLGGGADGPSLRALGRVLGDLAGVGYDAQWTTIRASDVGAPHHRGRVFVVAYPAGNPWRLIDGKRGKTGFSDGTDDLTLLSTPQARDHKGIPGDGYNTASLPRDVSLLPTPKAGDVKTGIYWGEYAPAITRWEQVIGRPAPAPTQPGKTGKPQLSPIFVEWMMGLPEGWVTDIGISRAVQLRALGNGVVPQQAALAVTHLLGKD